MKFKSKGMQWATFRYLGDSRTDFKKQFKKIGYWNIEKRIKNENLTIIHDDKNIIVVISEQNVLIQIENN